MVGAPAKRPDRLLWKDIEGLTTDILTKRHRFLISPQKISGNFERRLLAGRRIGSRAARAECGTGSWFTLAKMT
jgi:hypothetical protein